MATEIPVGYRATLTVTNAGNPVWPYEYAFEPALTPPIAFVGNAAGAIVVIGQTPGTVTLTVTAGAQSGSVEIEVVPTPLEVTLGTPEPNV